MTGILDGGKGRARRKKKKRKTESATLVGQRKVNKLVYVYIYTPAKMLHDGF